MELSIMVPTHGMLSRSESNVYLSPPDRHVDVVAVAQAAERLGYHSVCFPDHVLMTRATDYEHPANDSGERAYAGDAYMLDALVSMGAVAAATSTIRLGTGVLVAPYRHPLSDARQLMTADVISGGRVIVGVGAGWMKEEFDALGVSYESRGRVLEECVEIYRRAWSDERVEFHGEFFSFSDVSMDPKPVQRPMPLIFGAASKVGARRAARHGDGLCLLFTDPHADIDGYAGLLVALEEEAGVVGRSLDSFEYSALASAMPGDQSAARASGGRRILTGTSDHFLDDLRHFAQAGYSRCILYFDVPSGTFAEYLSFVEWVGEEVLPEARGIETRVPPI